MLLEKKTAVIYGAGGAVGGAVARAFAREGAKVFLTGRYLSKVEAVAKDILAANGSAEAASVDALDERDVERHLDAVVERAGGIDISFNAIGVPASVVADQGMQGVPLSDLSVESFSLPIATYTRAHFLTGRGAARRMAQTKQSGVILMHTPEPARIGVPLLGGMGPAWAAMEAMCRSFSAELAAYGIRAVCLRSTGLPETRTIEIIFGIHAKVLGIPREGFQKLMEGMGHTRRSTTLQELTNAAVFLASDLAAGMTGTVANLTGGKTSDYFPKRIQARISVVFRLANIARSETSPSLFTVPSDFKIRSGHSRRTFRQRILGGGWIVIESVRRNSNNIEGKFTWK